MGRPDQGKAARDSQVVRKKKRIPQKKPIAGAMSASRKLQLFESDKGSFYNHTNWIEECEYDKGLYYNNYGDDFDEESGESDRNSKNNVKSERNVIVSINTLQSLITSATRCKACHEPVRLVEDRKNAVGLACLLKTECVNQKCKQTDNNPTMLMKKKGDSFYEINRSFVLACRLTGPGYSAASRLTSILNLDKAVTKKSWLNHMTTSCNVAEEIAEGSMKKATIGGKEYMVKNGVLEVPPETDLSKEKMNIGVSVDGPWGSRGWASKQGIVDVCFKDTGKALDVILKTSYCKVCKNLKNKKEMGTIC